MDFLKNIGSTLADWGKGLGSSLSGLFNQGMSNMAGLGASTYLGNSPASPTVNTGSLSEKLNAIPIPVKTGPGITYTPIPQSVKDQDNVNKALQMMQNPGNSSLMSQSAFDLKGQLADKYGNPSFATGPGITSSPATMTLAAPAYNRPAITELSGYRNALPGGAQDSRVSNKQSGVPYLDAQGRLVTPKTGFAGLSGSGSYSMGGESIPATGFQGSVGSGGSAFTGLLGGVGGASGSVISSDDQDDPTDSKKPGNTTINIGGTGTAQNQQPPAILGAGNYVPPRDQLNVVPPTGSIDLGNLTSISSSLDKLINNPAAFNSDDFKALTANMDTTIATAYNKFAELNPTLENGVKNDPAQEAALQQTDDAYGLQSVIDNLKTQDASYMKAEAQRNDLQNAQAAIVEGYNQVIEDIKADPSLPAGIKQKRLNYIMDSNKTKLDALTNQIKILDQDLEIRNNSINRQLGIARLIQDDNAAKRAQENQNLQKFDMLVKGGAVGVLSDKDIAVWAKATGMSVNSIKAIKQSTRDPEARVITSTNDNGDVTYTEAAPGKAPKVLGTIKGIGNKQTSGSTNTTTVQNAALAPAGKALREIAAANGGSVPAEAYRAAYQTFITQHPSMGKEFLANFPVEQFLTEEDRFKFK